MINTVISVHLKGTFGASKNKNTKSLSCLTFNRLVAKYTLRVIDKRESPISINQMYHIFYSYLCN